MTANTNSAALAISGLLAQGSLKSRHEEYLQTRIREKGSFYTRSVSEKGVDAAEKELAEWMRKERMPDFAAAVETVVKGMLAVAQVDNESKHVFFTPLPGGIYIRPYGMRSGCKTILLLNPQFTGCACTLLEGSSLWAPRGKVGLKAITLQFGPRLSDYEIGAQVGLVFPPRAPYPVPENAYAVAAFDLNGVSRGLVNSVSLPPERHLLCSLGVERLENVVSYRQTGGGSIEEAAGYPGATNFFADNLPSLGDYLYAVADGLQTHGH